MFSVQQVLHHTYISVISACRLSSNVVEDGIIDFFIITQESSNWEWMCICINISLCLKFETKKQHIWATKERNFVHVSNYF